MIFFVFNSQWFYKSKDFTRIHLSFGNSGFIFRDMPCAFSMYSSESFSFQKNFLELWFYNYSLSQS